MKTLRAPKHNSIVLPKLSDCLRLLACRVCMCAAARRFQFKEMIQVNSIGDLPQENIFKHECRFDLSIWQFFSLSFGLRGQKEQMQKM